MSSNNEIYIIKQLGGYDVFDRDVETKHGNLIGVTKTLEAAIKLANKYQEEVEYGLCIDI